MAKALVLKEKNSSAIKEAVRILKAGGVVVYPTETAYGIGVDATNARARRKVYALKKRPAFKKLTVIVGSVSMAYRYIRMDSLAKRLMKEFMPGPLTLVCDSRRSSAIGSDVAFRIPGHHFALRLARAFGKPITATSANTSGKKNIYEIKMITKLFRGKADLIIDGGNLLGLKPSTIFDTRTRKILREGPVSRKEIEEVAGKL